MTVTQERNLKINFCDPYIIVGQTILIQKSLEGVINSYKDLNDPKYTVTSKLGTTGEMAVKRMIPKCNYKSFETEPEAALEVVNGKAHAFVYDLPYCVVFMAQQGAGSLVFLDKPFTYEPLAWAVRKGGSGFHQLPGQFPGPVEKRRPLRSHLQQVDQEYGMDRRSTVVQAS